MANRFGLLIVMFMLLSSVFSMVGSVSPLAGAQERCAEGEVLNKDTGECMPAAELPPPDCAEDEMRNADTGECDPVDDAAPPECAEDEMRNPDTGQCDPVDAAAPPDCAEDEMLNPDTGQCDAAVDAPQSDCAEGEALNPDTGACEPTDGGMVDISKFECPSGFTGEGSNPDDFGSMCTEPMSGVAFEAYDSVGVVGGGSTDPGGYLQVSELPLGQVSIVESIPDGYGAPYVFCASGDDPNSLGGFEGYDVINGYYATIDFGSADYYACAWYNIPEDDGGITITKWLCPAGYDSTDILYDTLLEDCTQGQDDVEFSIGNGTETYDSGMTGDDGPGRLIFEEYQPGAVVITETIPEGYGTPAVLCSSRIYVEEPVGDFQTSNQPTEIMDVAADGSISTEVAENRHYMCYWFNFPSDDYDIVIHKYVCPAGYAPPEAFAYGSLTGDCTGETRDGVVFHLGDQTQATGEVIPGGVAFVGYEPGDVVIREEVPAGYAPYVFCGQSSGGVAFDQVTPVPMLLTLAEDGSITVNLPENSYLMCYWFNVLTETSVPDTNLDVVDEVDEEEEPGYIAGLTLQHFACDPGLDPRLNQGRYTLLQLCIGAGKPAFVYHIYVDQTLVESVGLQTAAGAWGEVFLPAAQQEPIPAGLVTIMVEQPAGYAGARVNCLLSRTDDSSEEIEPNLINETSIMVNVGPGESLVCEWFNAPVDPGIDISAWICPPGYDATDVTLVPYAVLLQDCAQPHDGVEFALGLDLSIDDMGAYSFGFTGEDGHLRFEDYNPGALVIAETIPEGYGTPLAYCSFDYDPSSGLVNSSSYRAGSIRPDGGIPENSLLTCDFFNFPDD